MGVALTNPNDRRRINGMARLVKKSRDAGKPISPENVVKMYMQFRSEGRGFPTLRDTVYNDLGMSDTKRTGKKLARNAAGVPLVFANAFSSNLSEADKTARRKEYGKIKRAIVKAMVEADPAGYKSARRLLHFNGKGQAPTYGKVAYSKRALGGKANRYLVKIKKGPALYSSTLPENAARLDTERPTRRLFNKFNYTPQAVNEYGVKYYNEESQEIHKAMGVSPKKSTRLQPFQDHSPAGYEFPNGKKYSSRFGGQTDRWRSVYGLGLPADEGKAKRKAMKELQASRAPTIAKLRKEIRQEARKGEKYVVGIPGIDGAQYLMSGARSNPGIFGGVALTNPGIFGGVALTNPTVEGTVDYVKYALPIAAGAGVGVLAHYYLVPMIDENVYSKIPVVGEYLSQYGYAATGLLAGAALGAGAAMLDGDLRHYAALAAAGVIAAGGALQVAQMLGLVGSDAEAEEEAEANPGIFGGVALTNGGIFGNLAGADEVEAQIALFRGKAKSGQSISKMYGKLTQAGLSDGEAKELVNIAADVVKYEKKRAHASGSKKNTFKKRRDVALAKYDETADQFTAQAGIATSGSGAASQSAVGNPGIFSGVALTNPGIFGALGMAGGYGDGMAYEIASITPVDETAHAYSGAGAAMADAMHCGADLDVVEGQAAVAGEGAWNAKFGAPPVRIAPMGGAQGDASHLAGRQGHRWGWLIKMVGFPQFQKMAALPPAQRLNVIQRVRKAAVDTFTREMAAANAGAAEAQENPGIFGNLGASGAFTSEGAGTSYGSTLFAADASF